MKKALFLFLIILILNTAAVIQIRSERKFKQSADEALSPKIIALQKETDSGNSSAVAAFWQEISRQGTPLIESIPGDGQHSLVTFLWKDNGETKNVVVVGAVAGWKFNKGLMTRLRETNVWYKTFTLGNDARFTYFISPNDSLVDFQDIKNPAEIPKRTSTFLTDPLNPNRYPGLARELSTVSLPGALPQPWIKRQANVPAGELKKQIFKSAILNNEREIAVYTPPGYQPEGKPYRLLVVFDGPAYYAWIPTPVILDNLTAKNLISPVVAVFVDNASQTLRGTELPCYEPFADFLAKELIPWVHKNYHVTSDPKQTVVAGSSHGGLASSFAAFRHPEIFGNVLSQAGSYYWKPDNETEPGWLIKQFNASPNLPIKFYMDVGQMESYPTSVNGPSGLAANRQMRDVLKARGYQVNYREFNGGHEYFNWQGTIADGLIALIGN